MSRITDAGEVKHVAGLARELLNEAVRLAPALERDDADAHRTWEGIIEHARGMEDAIRVDALRHLDVPDTLDLNDPSDVLWLREHTNGTLETAAIEATFYVTEWRATVEAPGVEYTTDICDTLELALSGLVLERMSAAHGPATLPGGDDKLQRELIEATRKARTAKESLWQERLRVRRMKDKQVKRQRKAGDGMRAKVEATHALIRKLAAKLKAGRHDPDRDGEMATCVRAAWPEDAGSKPGFSTVKRVLKKLAPPKKPKLLAT